MKYISFEYLIIFMATIILVLAEKPFHGNVNQEIILASDSHLINTESPGENLAFRSNKSRPENHGEKVETIVITCPVSKYPEIRLINLFTLQKIVFSKRNHSLISHYYLFISKTLQKTPLVNILRI